MDQSLFAAPHGFSQRITSFFACACQGIHQMPLRHLIVLIANAHHLLDLASLSSSLALEGRPNLTIRPSFLCRTPARNTVTFYNRVVHDAIDVFDPVPFKKTSRRATSGPDLLDQLLEIKSGTARSGNGHQQFIRGNPEGTPTTNDQSDRLPTYLRSLHHI